MDNQIIGFKSLLPIITFGDVVDERAKRPTGLNTYNGLVSSLALLVALVSISFSVTLFDMVSDELDKFSCMVTPTILMMTSLILIVGFCWNGEKITTDHISHGDAIAVGDAGFLKRLNNLLSTKLTLIGMIVFMTFSCTLDICQVLDTIHRLHVPSDDILNHDHHLAVTPDLIFHISRIFFVVGELVFCCKFHAETFQDTWYINHGLAIIQSTNMALWFGAIPSEFESKKTKNAIETYLYPSIIEFTLLSAECFAHFIFRSKSKRYEHLQTNQGVADIPENDIEERPTITNIFQHGQHVCELSDADIFQSGLQEQVGAELDNQPLIVDASQVHDVANRSANNEHYPYASFHTLAFSVSAVVFIVYCILTFKANFGDETTYYWTPHQYYNVVYWSLSLVAIILGYIFSGYLKPKDKPFNGLDYLVLFSVIGLLVHDILPIIGIVDYKNDHVYNSTSLLDTTTNIYLTGMVLNTLEVILQVPFVFFAERLTSDDCIGWKAAAFKTIVLFLALLNFIAWIMDTFVINTQGTIDSVYFTKIQLVAEILTPAILFYRFNCFLLLVRAFLNI